MKAERQNHVKLERTLEGLVRSVLEATLKAVGDWQRRAAGAPVREPLNMRCRVPGCEDRSKGPRFRFLCVRHRKLPVRKQRRILASYHAHQQEARA